MSNLKYIIHNESILYHGSDIFSCGGCVALYFLFENLKSLGEEVFLSHRVDQHLSGLKTYEESDFLSPEVDLSECITIYPEIIAGNPVNSKYAVRWLLHTPNNYAPTNPSTWGEEDLLFAYAPWTAKESEQEGYKVQDEILQSLFIDYNIFKDLNNPRQGTCHIVKKGGIGERDDLPLGSDDIEYMTKSPELLAEAFNKYENFYCYDTRTFLPWLAALCGCNSIIACRPESRKEFFENLLGFDYGIAYGIDDLDRAKKTRWKLRHHLIEKESVNLSTVKNFIKLTKEKYECP